MLYLRVALLVVCLILAGDSLAGAAMAPTKMVIAYASIGPRVAPLWAAEEQGIFWKNGTRSRFRPWTVCATSNV